MAKTSLVIKQQRLKTRILGAKKSGKKIIGVTKYYNRCGLCGRDGGYLREYDMCRCCFVKNARLGLIMGVKKASR